MGSCGIRQRVISHEIHKVSFLVSLVKHRDFINFGAKITYFQKEHQNLATHHNTRIQINRDPVFALMIENVLVSAEKSQYHTLCALLSSSIVGRTCLYVRDPKLVATVPVDVQNGAKPSTGMLFSSEFLGLFKILNSSSLVRNPLSKWSLKSRKNKKKQIRFWKVNPLEYKPSTSVGYRDIVQYYRTSCFLCPATYAYIKKGEFLPWNWIPEVRASRHCYSNHSNVETPIMVDPQRNRLYWRSRCISTRSAQVRLAVSEGQTMFTLGLLVFALS